MTSRQRIHISSLVKRYSANSGTESLIGYVADTTGMLAACQKLMETVDAGDVTSTEWLQQECYSHGVDSQSFLQEVSRIVELFHPDQNEEDHYATLGVSAGADPAKIKQAYRRLSLQYHPDTASSQYRKDPEKFIKITKAYHALLGGDHNRREVHNLNSRNQWRSKKERKITSGQRKRMFAWVFGLLAVLVIASIIASVNHKKRAMLAGLQESSGAFIPPVRGGITGQVNQANAEAKKKSTGQLFQAEKTETSPSNEVIRTEETAVVDVQQLQSQMQQKASEIENTEPARTVHRDRPYDFQESESNDSPESTAAINDRKKTSEEQPLLVNTKVPGTSSENLRKTSGDGKLLPPQGKEKKAFAASIETNFAEKAKIASIAKNDSAIKKATSKESKGKINELASAAITKEAGPAIRSKIQRNANKNEIADTHTAAVSVRNEPASVTKKQNRQDKEVDHKLDRLMSEDKAVSVDATNLRNEIQEKTDLESRIKMFLGNYIEAYEQRNIVLFSRFFQADAVENDKPFSKMLPVYNDLFEATSNIFLRVNILSWRQVGEEIFIEGRFAVSLDYKKGQLQSGTGPISFVLKDDDATLRVHQLTYSFEG